MRRVLVETSLELDAEVAVGGVIEVLDRDEVPLAVEHRAVLPRLRGTTPRGSAPAQRFRTHWQLIEAKPPATPLEGLEREIILIPYSPSILDRLTVKNVKKGRRDQSGHSQQQI